MSLYVIARVEANERHADEAMSQLTKSSTEMTQRLTSQLADMRLLVNRYEAKLESLGIDLGMEPSIIHTSFICSSYLVNHCM
jgi:hypothetical protein